jgi:hypothetical protein
VLKTSKFVFNFQSLKHLPVEKDFFQKEKDRSYRLRSPFSLFLSTLSDRLAKMTLPLFLNLA